MYNIFSTFQLCTCCSFYLDLFSPRKDLPLLKLGSAFTSPKEASPELLAHKNEMLSSVPTASWASFYYNSCHHTIFSFSHAPTSSI